MPDTFAIQPLQTRILRNGTRLHFLSAGTQPTIRIEIIFAAGSRIEAKAGAAYFTAKMLPEGTHSYRAGELSEAIDSLGAFLHIASGIERITIAIDGLRRHLPNLLPILQEIIYAPTLPEKEFRESLHLTCQNLRVQEEKNAYQASKHFKQQLFGANHPYGRVLTEATTHALTLADIQAHYQQYIHKASYDILLVGQFDEVEISLVEEYLGERLVKDFSLPTDMPKPESYSKGRILIPGRDMQTTIRMGRVLFAQNHPDYFNFLVMNEILGGASLESRLMKSIREQKGYTYGIHSSIVTLSDTGYWVIATDVKGDLAQATLHEIEREIWRLREELVDEEELGKFRNHLLGSLAGILNTPFDLGEIFKNLYFNKLDYSFYDTYVNTIRNITPQTVREVAQKYLNSDELLTVVVGNTQAIDVPS